MNKTLSKMINIKKYESNNDKIDTFFSSKLIHFDDEKAGLLNLVKIENPRSLPKSSPRSLPRSLPKSSPRSLPKSSPRSLPKSSPRYYLKQFSNI